MIKLFNSNFFFNFMCMSVLHMCVYVHHVHTSCLQRSEEGVVSPENWSYKWWCKPPSVFWELNLGPLQEHQVLLNNEPSL